VQPFQHFDGSIVVHTVVIDRVRDEGQCVPIMQQSYAMLAARDILSY